MHSSSILGLREVQIRSLSMLKSRRSMPARVWIIDRYADMRLGFGPTVTSSLQIGTHVVH